MASMAVDPELSDTLMHLSGYIKEREGGRS